MKTVPIFEHSVLGTAVSGRAIYNAIGKEHSNGQRDMFSDWFRSREKKLALRENVDFITLRRNNGYVSPGGRSMIEFVVSLDTAKQVAGIQPAGRGRALLEFLVDYNQKGHQASPAQATEVSAPVLPFDVVPPAPEPPMGTQVDTAPVSLTPAQQLLQQAQRLVEQEATNKANAGEQGERLTALEAKIDLLARLFFDAARSLAGYSLTESKVTVETGTQTAYPFKTDSQRARIVRMVDSYAASKQMTHQDVWRMLYGQLNTDYHFDAWQHMQSGKDNYLDVVEKNGQLSNMYTIATQRLATAQA